MSLKMLDVVSFVLKQGGPTPREAIAGSFKGCDGWLTQILSTLVSNGYLRRESHGVYEVGEKVSVSKSGAGVFSGLAGREALFCCRWRGMLSGGLLDGAQGVLDRHGVRSRLMVLDAPEDSIERVWDALGSGRDGGLIFFDMKPLPDAFVWSLRGSGLPAVQIGQNPDAEWDCVDWDRFTAFFKLTDSLIAAGCDPLLFLDFPESMRSRLAVRKHRAGFLAAAEIAGARTRIIAEGDADLNGDPKDSRFAAAVQESPSGSVPGVVCGTQFQGVPAMMALEAMGRRLGVDARLAGVVGEYDPQLPLCREKFTKVLVKSDVRVGEVAAEQLLARMAGMRRESSLHLLRLAADVREAVGIHHRLDAF